MPSPDGVTVALAAPQPVALFPAWMNQLGSTLGILGGVSCGLCVIGVMLTPALGASRSVRLQRQRRVDELRASRPPASLPADRAGERTASCPTPRN